MTRLISLCILLLAATACAPVVERWDGELDDCSGNSGDLEGRRVLAYLNYPGGGEIEGDIGVAVAPGEDEELLFTDVDRGEIDGADVEFEADFGEFHSESKLDRDGADMRGDIDITFPVFFGTGNASCELRLELL